ncbi:hypothetical protein [Sphingobium limneticum]|uniref:Head-tail adaptor protein n=1 Tax=Sphingobium limneticum TaxID=1007511 RepID=A0A5J5I5Q5_9SPHN|nr:hypothetical protein [Sphingobium limneticum]KAA9018297.1 hypothetical protein F4U96_09300 [Sphingobium limneticum]KAA9030933.1 hypothetical protein F4U95_09250 [Sphingobium limneticum]
MSFYDDLRAGVGPGSEIEATFGVPAILTRTTGGVKDPDSGNVSSKTITPHNVNVAKRTVEITVKDGGKAEATAFDIWFEPLPGDVITLAGKSYRVASVEADEPDGIPIGWIAVVGSGS